MSQSQHTTKFLPRLFLLLIALFHSISAESRLVVPSVATSYYPANTRMEGGFVDRRGQPLYTIQEYLVGRAPYVSVAMDTRAFPYGTSLEIPEIERYYNMSITFRVVDTGHAFRGRGFGRIDICTENYQSSIQNVVNQRVTLIATE